MRTKGYLIYEIKYLNKKSFLKICLTEQLNYNSNDFLFVHNKDLNKFLKKYYFISKFDTKNIDKLDKQTVVIYRNYSAKTIQESLILKIKNYCQKKGLKIIL